MPRGDRRARGGHSFEDRVDFWITRSDEAEQQVEDLQSLVKLLREATLREPAIRSVIARLRAQGVDVDPWL